MKSTSLNKKDPARVEWTVIMKQLDEWIEFHQDQEELFKAHHHVTSEIATRAMKRAYQNVKNLMEGKI